MKIEKPFLYKISALLTVVVAVYIFLTLDWAALRQIFLHLRWGWLLLAFGIYFVSIVFRAMRFRVLLHSLDVSLRELILISSLHNMFVYIMPAKSGEISYILLSKSRFNLPLSEGTATLLTARFYDFVVFGLILAFILPFARNQMPAWIFQSSILFSTIGLTGAFLLILFIRTRWALFKQPDPRYVMLNRLLNAWNRLVSDLRQIQSKRQHFSVTFLTLGIWLCLYIDYYFMAQSLGAPITFFQISIIMLVMVPLTLLPLQGFANIGTHEVGWVSVLRIFGYSYKSALTIALGSHFILLMSVLLYGGLSLLPRVTSQKEDENDNIKSG